MPARFRHQQELRALIEEWTETMQSKQSSNASKRRGPGGAHLGTFRKLWRADHARIDGFLHTARHPRGARSQLCHSRSG